MFFPLKDDNPTEITPFVTVTLIVANVLVWLVLQQGLLGSPTVESVCTFGAIPAEITGYADRMAGPCPPGGVGSLTLLTSMFLHGSWMHLIGNMWFLWVFGNNIEDSMGHLRFTVFYVLTGLLATAAHIAVSASSPVPLVGASGAISGVMGGYILLYPRVRVHVLMVLFYFIHVVPVKAVWMLGLWFAVQLISGGLAGASSGVAFLAHVGGFVAGVALIKLFARRKLVDAKRGGHRLTRDELSRWERW